MPFVSGGGVLNEGYMSGVGGLGNVPQWFGRNEQTVGWTVGAGLDYKLFPQQLFPSLPTWLLGPVTLRAEYIYQSLPSETYAYGTQVYRTKSDGSFLRGALIYRFGDYAPRPLRGCGRRRELGRRLRRYPGGLQQSVHPHPHQRLHLARHQCGRRARRHLRRHELHVRQGDGRLRRQHDPSRT